MSCVGVRGSRSCGSCAVFCHRLQYWNARAYFPATNPPGESSAGQAAAQEAQHDRANLSKFEMALVTEVSALAQQRALPVVGIGGITLDRAPSVMRAGTQAVAVISDLFAGGDPETRVCEYRRVVGAANPS